MKKKKTENSALRLRKRRNHAELADELEPL